jgi:hypothetical protein
MSHYKIQLNSTKYICDSWFQTFAMLWVLHYFFLVIPRCLNCICRRFGTLCSIFIGRVNCKIRLVHTTYEYGTYSVPKCRHIKIQTTGNHPKERMQHMYTGIQQDATMVSCFITRSLYMFRALSVPIIRSTLTAVDSHWHNMCYVGSWILW